MNNTDTNEMPLRVRVTGGFDVQLPCEDAFVLFTARGEGRWAEGWDPRFPAGEDEDDTIPGTTFVVAHGDADSVWVVVRAEPPRSIAYARVTPADTAGTVTVTLEPGGERSTHVTVAYDLTALTSQKREHLARFRAGFDDFLGHWERAIAEVV
jgi:hypothetical protein